MNYIREAWAVAGQGDDATTLCQFVDFEHGACSKFR
jgi:hypothetical protein